MDDFMREKKAAYNFWMENKSDSEHHGFVATKMPRFTF